MAIPKDVLDALMKDYKNPEDLIGESGLLKQLTKQLLERAMQAEMTEHLGYEKNATADKKTTNARNGSYQKRIKGEFGNLDVTVPRDRDATFEPIILPKGQSRFTGFDDKIIALYARGMTTRDIQAHLEEMYGVEVSPTLISQVTRAVQEEITLWQNRPLDDIYPIVYLDAIRIKVRQEGRVINKAVYLAIGVNLDGIKEVLGMWTAETEGAKFWLQVVTELVAEPGREGHLHRLRRWPQGVPGSDRISLSRHPDPALSGAHGATQFKLCFVEAAQSRCRGSEIHLLSSDHRAGRDCHGRVCGQVGRHPPDDQPLLAAQLGATHTAVLVPHGHPQGDLHNQRHRVGQHVVAKSDQEPRIVSQRRGDAQAALLGATEYREEMDDADPKLEIGAQSVYDHLRRQDANLLTDGTIYTKFLTGPCAWLRM